MAATPLQSENDFSYALYCQQASARLGNVRKDEGVNASFVMPTRWGLKQDELAIVQSKLTAETVVGLAGKDNHRVRYIEESPEGKWYLDSLFALNFSSTRAPVRASFLMPEDITLQNSDKTEKEIAILFHEPTAEEVSPVLKRQNFRQAALMTNNREADFSNNIKLNIIGEIQHQLVNEVLKKKSRNGKVLLTPKDAAIRLVFSGEGLGGLDAQLSLFYFMEDLVADLKRGKRERKYADLSDLDLEIELSLIDSSLPKKLAERAKPLLEKIKVEYPKIKFKSYSFDTGQSKGKLGGEHIFSNVSDPEQVLIQHEIRKRSDGSLVELQNNSNNKPVLLLKNRGILSFIYQRASFRLIHQVVTGIRNLFIGIFMPTLANRDVLQEKLEKREAELYNESDDLEEECNVKEMDKKEAKKVAGLKPHELDHHEFGKLVSDLDETNRLQMFKAMPPIENLVFEGGGVKGLVYAGALKRMQEANLQENVKRVAGSSAGAIVSALLAVGYSPAVIEAKMKSIDFRALMDRDSPLFWNPPGVSHISDAINLVSKHGIYKGKAFLGLLEDLLSSEIREKLKQQKEQEFLQQTLGSQFSKYDLESESHYIERLENEKIKLIEQNGGRESFDIMIGVHVEDYLKSVGIRHSDEITFGQLDLLCQTYPDLGFKALYITGTKLRTGELVVFSHETYPDLPIKSAVRASMSFPGAFVPYKIDGEEYADGGIANNWPMGIFDKKSCLPPDVALTEEGANPCTLGFLVDSADEIKRRWCGFEERKLEKVSLKGFIGQVVEGLHSRSEDLQKKYQMQAVQIFDEDVPTLDFSLTPKTQDRLINSGYNEMDRYVRYYRQPNVRYDGLYFKSLEEKYHSKQLSFEQISLIIENEIAPYLEKLQLFQEKYTKQLEIHEQTLKALEETRKSLISQGQKLEQLSMIDEQIDTLENESINCEAALDIIAKKRTLLVKEKHIAEQAMAEVGGATKKGEQGFQPAKGESLAFQRPIGHKAIPENSVIESVLPPTQLGMRIHEPKLLVESAWEGLKTFLDNKGDIVNNLKVVDGNFEFELNYHENQKNLKTAIKREDERVGFFLEEVPVQDDAKRKAFEVLFAISIEEMLGASKDQVIDIDLTGSDSDKIIMKEVLDSLIEQQSEQCVENNLTFNIKGSLSSRSRLDSRD
jgi:predicted acylesterase/phospholipase RssA